MAALAAFIFPLFCQCCGLEDTLTLTADGPTVGFGTAAPVTFPVGVLDGSMRSSLVHMRAGEMGEVLGTLKGVAPPPFEELPCALNCW